MGETYWQHFRFAARLALRFWWMSVVMLIHAIFPDWKRFEHRLKPFSKSLQQTVVSREMQQVHTTLLERLAARMEEAEDETPGNGV